MIERCPYCGYEGTVAEIDDHVLYLQRIGDPEHEDKEPNS